FLLWIPVQLLLVQLPVEPLLPRPDAQLPLLPPPAVHLLLVQLPVVPLLPRPDAHLPLLPPPAVLRPPLLWLHAVLQRLPPLAPQIPPRHQHCLQLAPLLPAPQPRQDLHSVPDPGR